MDDEMFDTQCRDVARCIKGLSLTLVEAGAGTSLSKVISDVHKLIQSFRLLGNHYVSELLKKRRELETKSQEVKELSRKLERGESHTYHVGAQKPDAGLAVDKKRHTETTIPGDGVSVKNVEEFSMREDDVGKLPGTYSAMFQTRNIKSEELDKSLKGLVRLDGYLDEVQERVENVAVCNEFLSREFAQAPQATPGIRLRDRSRGNSSTAVCNEENGHFLEAFNELGAIEQSCNKRRREFIDLGSDSEERKRGSNATSWPKTRKPNERKDLDLRLSHKSKQGTVQEIVAQEQNMVESLCKAMEQYHSECHKFWLRDLMQA